MKTILIGLSLACVLLGEESYVLQQAGVRIHVIAFSMEANQSFEFFSADKDREAFGIAEYYSNEAHTFIVNGSYFDGNLNPVGYCRIHNQELSNVVDTKLSGFLTTMQSGELSLH